MIRILGDNMGVVEAPDEDEALHRWCDENGYDSPEAVADEYDCQPNQIRVVPVDN